MTNLILYIRSRVYLHLKCVPILVLLSHVETDANAVVVFANLTDGL